MPRAVRCKCDLFEMHRRGHLRFLRDAQLARGVRRRHTLRVATKTVNMTQNASCRPRQSGDDPCTRLQVGSGFFQLPGGNRDRGQSAGRITAAGSASKEWSARTHWLAKVKSSLPLGGPQLKSLVTLHLGYCLARTEWRLPGIRQSFHPIPYCSGIRAFGTAALPHSARCMLQPKRITQATLASIMQTQHANPRFFLRHNKD